MCLALQDTLWDILETEAFERYFINNAEKPAFLILHKWNLLSRGGFELLMNYVARLGRFKTHKEAIARLDQAISTAIIPISVYKQKRRGFLKYGKKQLYATVDPTKPRKAKEELRMLGYEVKKNE